MKISLDSKISNEFELGGVHCNSKFRLIKKKIVGFTDLNKVDYTVYTIAGTTNIMCDSLW